MPLFRVPLARVLATAWLTAGAVLPQSAPAPQQTPPPADPNPQEIVTKDAPALFKSRVNLVMVPVVIRDKNGHTVATFTKENFQLFDRGKLQEITRFSVEKAGDLTAKAMKTADALPSGEPAGPPDIPERFIAYLFDDVHIQFGDLVRSRDAASRQIAALKPTERAAIFTTSGQQQVDFTGDIEKLQQGLLHLRMRPLTGGGIPQCPDLNYYMSDLIINHSDQQATDVAVQETLACNNSNMTVDQLKSIVDGIARRLVAESRHETQVTLMLLQDVIRRMAIMPGQRIVTLISPGFLVLEDQNRKSDVIERAIKANVVINSLDARGLWTDPTIDASIGGHTNTPQFLIMKTGYDRSAASAQSDVLAEVAYGTGGSFFQNNNDLDEGMRRLTVAPDAYYLLGFSPQNMKLDGAFHSLKVSIKPPPGGSIDLQARKGYYAPRKLSTAQETALEEIEEALFSREELVDFPVELHTQFFKSDKDATINVLCRLDARHVQFRKVDGRNNNDVVIVAGLFDRNGNFMSAQQKTLSMKLKDETLAKMQSLGQITVKTTFSVPPGTYMIRLVVRDSEAQQMSALNGALTIQ